MSICPKELAFELGLLVFLTDFLSTFATDLLSVEKNIDPSVTDSADIAALTALELQRLNLANKDSKSAKNRIKEIDEAITKITDKYTITG